MFMPSQTKTVTTEDGNQASIEYCYITSEEYQQHAATAVSEYNAYESIYTTVNDHSGNTKYNYILDWLILFALYMSWLGLRLW